MSNDKSKIYKRQRLNDEELMSSDFDDVQIDGLEKGMHFDFSDDDVRRYRQRNEEKAKVRESRSETVAYGLENKRKTNKEIRRVMYVMFLLFAGLITYFVYFNLFGSRDIMNDSRNSRLKLIAQSVKRGDIMSSDGEVLAEEIEYEDGSTDRNYPYGCTFAHVIGTSQINRSGVELTADYDLITSGINPLRKALNDIQGNKNPGNSIYTTLNANLQKVAHDSLGDREGAIVAIEPSTGKVLALLSKPDYDPNYLVENYNDIISDESSKVLLNQATQGQFTPGSIFKIVTTLAYLRSGVSGNDYSYTCDGYVSLQSDDDVSSIRCYDGEVHGTVDLKESFAESCNASFATIGLLTGVKRLNKTADELLFNQKLPSAFSTTKSYFSLSPSDTEWQIGATAIGQGNTTISPLHAAMLTSCIANDGTLMKPYVIDRVVTAEGETVKQYDTETYGSLMSSQEVSKLQDMMEAVVTEGTGYNLSYKSYSSAGKTGTAEVAGRGNNAWFVGYAPAENPRIAVCILIEDAGTASSETVPIAGEMFDAYLNAY